MANKTLKHSLVKTSALNQELKKDMFELFQKYYDHVTYERFQKDLEEKTHVFLFEEITHRRLVGFSTIFRKEIPSIAKGSFLFSGDTVMHEDYWGSKVLQRAFFWFILNSKMKSPFKPVYWMLMSKGVKTYLMMRKNFRLSYPNYHGATPEPYQTVLNKFYQLKFPRAFNPESGLIHFEEKLGSVKHSLEVYPENARSNPEASYFFQKNPDWPDGVEMACVTEICFRDFFFHLAKFFLPKNRSV